MYRKIEKFFKFKELNTDLKTEITSGFITFIAMSYIIFVNPAILSKAGMDFNSVFLATCLSAGLTTILMGLFTNYPIALASGMGENIFFTYIVCLGLKVPYQIALGCVFIEGLLFIFLTLIKIREAILDSIPKSIRYGIASGIGLLIGFIGFKDAGFIKSNPSTFISLASIDNPAQILSIFSLLIISIFMARKIKFAMLLGVFISCIFGILFGIIKYQGLISFPFSNFSTFMKMDILGALNFRFFSVIFVFLFMDVFDTVGTLAGLAELGGFVKNGKIPKANRVLLFDAIGTCLGASLGTSTVTSYIESASGIANGAKSGFTSVVVGFLFLISIFFSPIVSAISGGYKVSENVFLYPITAPILIIVGMLMLKSISKIDWDDYTEFIPAFIATIVIPFSFSISTGIALSFISYAILKLFSKRAKEVSWLVYLLAIIFLIRFIFLKILY